MDSGNIVRTISKGTTLYKVRQLNSADSNKSWLLPIDFDIRQHPIILNYSFITEPEVSRWWAVFLITHSNRSENIRFKSEYILSNVSFQYDTTSYISTELFAIPESEIENKVLAVVDMEAIFQDNPYK